MDCSTLGLPVHHQLPEFTQWTHCLNGHESVMPSNHLILCPPLFPLPSIFHSIGVFSNESVLSIRWPKDWSFSFSISPSNEIQDWFPLGLTGWISLQSKGLPTAQLKSINSSALSHLYSPMLTSVHDFAQVRKLQVGVGKGMLCLLPG